MNRALQMGLALAEDMQITSNVLINFGNMEENSFDGTWNHQKGTETGVIEWDRYTTGLQDAASLTASDTEVKFGKVTGLGLLGDYHPVRD